jgi:hypothetical protein
VAPETKMTEWRVRVPGTGPWASGSWNFSFATEAEARSFALENGGEAYLHTYFGDDVEDAPQIELPL